MNIEWFKANLEEAIEALQSILESPEEALESPSISLAHAYYHLNAAYRGAHYEGDAFEAGGSGDDFPFRFFPTDLPEIYGSWTKE